MMDPSIHSPSKHTTPVQFTNFTENFIPYLNLKCANPKLFCS
jgi:hypothetical protein